MKQNTPIILVNSLNKVSGGLTKAVMKRANTLAEEFKQVYIFTLIYQQNQAHILKDLYEKNILSEKVTVFNLLEDLKPNQKPQKKYKHGIKEKGFIEFKDENQKLPSYRYYKDGLYKMYKRFDGHGNLMFIDYMDDARHRVKREEFNKYGLLARRRHMDMQLNKPRLDQYYDNKGDCYLTIWVNPETTKSSRVVSFGKNAKEYNSLDELKSEWLERKLNKISNPILMIEKRPLDQLVANLNVKSLRRVPVIHNNHFKKPFDNSAEVRNEYQYLCNHLDEFDKVVFLTQEQKDDVQNQFGERQNLEVIPHPAEQQLSQKKIMGRKSYNPYLAVSLTRYVKQKRLDEAIEAFQHVVREIPEAEYHIYGFGKEEQNLQDLIERLQLQENVKLKGFAEDAMETYQSAACSILTSDFEGFGMSLTESLSAGTPVVAFDAKYGPRDIVRDRVDGFIIEKRNKTALANSVIQLMKKPTFRNELAKNATQVTQRFSITNYKKEWINLINII
ncbi:glycosyltransferase [Virgibacillus halodenitrificans]|uniref:glycosyltransferase n=1 Tax=Virgibacillus halodenitrificans TaxID=1482 RepID=UPI000EF48D81|nr:glycosyltransferase [Virgibacillus halodenitrificans]